MWKFRKMICQCITRTNDIFMAALAQAQSTGPGGLLLAQHIRLQSNHAITLWFHHHRFYFLLYSHCPSVKIKIGRDSQAIHRHWHTYKIHTSTLTHTRGHAQACAHTHTNTSTQTATGLLCSVMVLGQAAEGVQYLLAEWSRDRDLERERAWRRDRLWLMLWNTPSTRHSGYITTKEGGNYSQVQSTPDNVLINCHLMQQFGIVVNVCINQGQNLFNQQQQKEEKRT